MIFADGLHIVATPSHSFESTSQTVADNKSLDQHFPNVPALMLDGEVRCEAGNGRQYPVRLRFSSYQGAYLPVLI
jgi:hypothetical protein